MEYLLFIIPIALIAAFWVFSLLKAGKDEPLEINARDRYKSVGKDDYDTKIYRKKSKNY
jgi:hypothetical protein